MDIYGFIVKALGVVATFGLIVLFHELGHFFACRIVGVRVETFSLGFGPELFSIKRGKTKYRIALFPVGGYCKMAGENKDEDVKGDSDEFLSQKWWNKIFIVFAGPFMNFILAWLVFATIMSFVGIDAPVNEAVVGGFLESSRAKEAGIMIGDRILSVDGEEIGSWQQMAEVIHSKPEKPVKLKIQRGEKDVLVTVTPRYDEASEISLIGITQKFVKKKYNIFVSLWESVKMVFLYAYYIVNSLWMMIVGKVKPELAGPIGIFTIVGQATSAGLMDLMEMIALISIMLGIVNLLPIPIVDGGVILMVIIEAVRRKPLPDKSVEVLQKVGLAIILFLVLFASYQDIMRLFVKK